MINNSTNTFLVGGAVRDALLGLPVQERDWVVVGSTPANMVAHGYKPIGKDFPVFLHPDTHEEYALARTERKSGKGYTGFTFYAEPDVTLEQDLSRRDLTINAIAQSADGTLIDPYHGKADLTHRILRHVSDAFVEDPVRILRLARFSAKLPDFTIATETKTLLVKMVEGGEVDALVPERVWKECEKSLSEKDPVLFFKVLEHCGALARVMPGLTLNDNTLAAFRYTIDKQYPITVRLSALTHALTNSALTHFSKQCRLPKPFSTLCKLVSHYHQQASHFNSLTPEEKVALLSRTDSTRRPERFDTFLMACQAIHQDFPISTIKTAAHRLSALDISPLLAKKLTGCDLAQAIHDLKRKTLDN